MDESCTDDFLVTVQLYDPSYTYNFEMPTGCVLDYVPDVETCPDTQEFLVGSFESNYGQVKVDGASLTNPNLS